MQNDETENDALLFQVSASNTSFKSAPSTYHEGGDEVQGRVLAVRAGEICTEKSDDSRGIECSAFNDYDHDW